MNKADLVNLVAARTELTKTDVSQVVDAAIETIIDSVVGPGAMVESGAVVRHSVVWPNAKIARGADLTRCIVCSADPVAGFHSDADL